MFGLTAIQALCLVVAQASPPATVPEPPSFFVGRAVCQECHDPALSAAAGGNEAADCGLRSGPCTLETIPQHGASFDTLRKTEARSIAAISGIAEQPTDSQFEVSKSEAMQIQVGDQLADFLCPAGEQR